MSALDFAVGPSFEVVITGDPSAEDTRKMLAALRREYQPRKVVVFRPMGEEEPAITRLAKYTLTQKAVKGKATAYVCRNYVCNFPTNDPAGMVAYLKSPEAKGKWVRFVPVSRAQWYAPSPPWFCPRNRPRTSESSGKKPAFLIPSSRTRNLAIADPWVCK